MRRRRSRSSWRPIAPIRETRPRDRRARANHGDGQSRQVLTYRRPAARALQAELEGRPAQPHDDMFAVNPDARESDLERIRRTQLRELWGGSSRK